MSNETSLPAHKAVLILPHIRVQNANAISSPMTWGFPAMTAFTGMMTALERRLGPDTGIALYGVGVVCHGFEAQVTSAGYTRAFHLTRNPVTANGSVAAIVEEGRVHLDLTLIFDARITDTHRGDAERPVLAERVADELARMRLAGGSVMPHLPGAARRPTAPVLELAPDEGQSDEPTKAYQTWFRRLARRLLPGFTLVSRDDLLQARTAELQMHDPAATPLDAWLDLSRWNTHAVQRPARQETNRPSAVDWVTAPRAGWIVPIPVGFAALTDLQAPGTVRGARDTTTPFRFVETVWSLGQWISPHRLKGISDLVWVPDHDPDHPSEHGLYRCRNGYSPPNPMLYPADTSSMHD